MAGPIGSNGVRVRLTLSKWAVDALEGLGSRKGYAIGTLYRLAVDLGTADLIAHFKTLESSQADQSGNVALAAVLPGVEAEANRRRAIKTANKAAKGAR